MTHECAFCGKQHAAARHASGDRDYQSTPPEWLLWQDWSSNELFGERLVCSTECADALEAKEKAEQERKRAEYQRRKDAGELTRDEEMHEAMLRHWLRAAHYWGGTEYNALQVAEIRGREKLLVGEQVFRKLDLPETFAHDATAPSANPPTDPLAAPTGPASSQDPQPDEP